MAVTTSSSSLHEPQRAQPPSRQSADGQILGGLLVLGGVGWFLQQINLFELATTTTLSILLIALGLGMVLTARRAGGIGLVFVGLALVVALASATALDLGIVKHGVGDRTYRPVLAGDLQTQYRVGAGSLTLDLRSIEAGALAHRHIEVRAGLGELVVLLPPAAEVPVAVLAKASAGEVTVPGLLGHEEGTTLEKRYADPGAAESNDVLVLDLDIGLGSISVQRSAR